MMKNFLILLLATIMSNNVHAQHFSYIYIQGDKETAFYVKYNNEMMPRYGKNYSVISKLAPGPIELQILFEKNIYPPVTFNILVPDGGERSFLLSKKENGFVLYDMQQQIVLNANNRIDDDKLPPKKEAVNLLSEVAVEEELNQTNRPKHGNPRYKELAAGEKRQEPYKAPPATQKPESTATSTAKKKSKKKSFAAPKTEVAAPEPEETVVAKEVSKVKVNMEDDAKVLSASTEEKPTTKPHKSVTPKPSKVRVQEEESTDADKVEPLPTDKRPVFIPKKQSHVKVNYEEPQFLDDVVLPNRHDNETTAPPPAIPPTTPTPITPAVEPPTPVETPTTISNSTVMETPVPAREEIAALPKTIDSCKGTINASALEALTDKLRKNEDDPQRLKNMADQWEFCYASEMARTIAATFTTDAGKYSLLKRLHPHIIDLDRYAALATVFEQEPYRQAFLELLQSK